MPQKSRTKKMHPATANRLRLCMMSFPRMTALICRQVTARQGLNDNSCLPQSTLHKRKAGGEVSTRRSRQQQQQQREPAAGGGLRRED